jgi:hypothetical protein
VKNRLIDALSYKRKANTYKTKYDSVLEFRLRDKEKIEKLQDDLLSAREKIAKLEEENRAFKIIVEKNCKKSK